MIARASSSILISLSQGAHRVTIFLQFVPRNALFQDANLRRGRILPRLALLNYFPFLSIYYNLRSRRSSLLQSSSLLLSFSLSLLLRRRVFSILCCRSEQWQIASECETTESDYQPKCIPRPSAIIRRARNMCSPCPETSSRNLVSVSKYKLDDGRRSWLENSGLGRSRASDRSSWPHQLIPEILPAIPSELLKRRDLGVPRRRRSVLRGFSQQGTRNSVRERLRIFVALETPRARHVTADDDLRSREWLLHKRVFFLLHAFRKYRDSLLLILRIVEITEMFF